MIERYLVTRPTLICAFVLVDSRIPLQQIDLEFINWLGERRIPFSIVYTKVDKLKKSHRAGKINGIRKGLLEHWTDLPPQFETSAEKGEGREEVLDYISGLI